MKDDFNLNESQLREFIDFLPAAIFETDLQGKIAHVNNYGCLLLGYTKNEMNGRSFLDFIIPEDRDRCLATSKNVLSGHFLGENEYTVLKKDGSQLPVFIESRPYKSQDGQLKGLRGILVDISKRKRVEAELRESEQKYRTLVNNLTLGIQRSEFKRNGKFIEVNKAMEDIHGYSREELLSLDISNLFVNIQDQIEFERELTRNKQPIKREFTIKKKDGTQILISFFVTPVLDVHGNIQYLDAIVEDITQRSKIEEKNRQFASIVEASHDAIFGISLELKITSWNKGAENIYGYSESEILSKPVNLIIPPDRLHELNFIKMKIREKEFVDDFETLGLRKDGSFIPVSITICPILNASGELTGASNICRDISERQKAEAILKSSEEKYRSLVNNLKVGVFRNTPDPKGQMLEFNKAMEEITGYTRNELLKMDVIDLYLNPEERKIVLEKMQLKQDSIEFYLKKKDGSPVLVLVTTCAVREENGKILYYDGILEDITERKKAEILISESEKKYRSLVNNLKLGIIRTTPSGGGRILETNKAFEEISGYSRNELLSIHMGDLYVYPEERVLKNLVEEKTEPVEFLLLRKDGKKIRVAITITPIRNGQGEVIYMDSIVEDITERKLAEEERRLATEKVQELYRIEKAQRQELEEESNARGLFINALAHELRTPLTPILNSTEVLKDIIDKDHLNTIQSKLVNNVLESSLNLARRLEELLDLGACSRGAFKLNLQPIFLHSLFENIINKFKLLINHRNQQLEVDIPETLPETVVDPYRLEQVLTNLLSNASKFSPEKSTIKLCARLEDNWLLVEVKDQGIGISIRDQERLFKPYHRVEQDRQVYPGTGLGLAICKEIIQAHQGKIWVTSDQGSGTTFSFRIPLIEYGN